MRSRRCWIASACRRSSRWITTHRFDAGPAEFRTELVDVYLHRVAFDFLLPAVDAIFQLTARQDVPWALGQSMQDRKLPARDGDFLAIQGH